MDDFHIPFEQEEREEKEVREERELRSSESGRHEISRSDIQMAMQIYKEFCTAIKSSSRKKIVSRTSSQADLSFASEIFVRLATSHLESKEDEQALINYNRAKCILDFPYTTGTLSNNFQRGKVVIGILQKMAIIYLEQNDCETALQFYHTAIDKTRELVSYMAKCNSSENDVTELIDSSNSKLSRLLVRVAVIHERMGHFLKGLEMYAEALKTKRLVKHQDKLAESSIMMRIGCMLAIAGKYDEAMKHFQNTLLFRVQTLSPDNSLIADINNKVAELHIRKGNYEEAMQSSLKALDILRHKQDKESILMLANTHNNLGNILMKEKDVNDSLRSFRTSIALKTDILGSTSPAVAETLQSMAELYLQVGDFEEATSRNKKALLIKELFLGYNHYSLASVLNGLGSSYLKQNDIVSAIIHHKRALDILRKYSQDFIHPDIGVAMNGIGAALKKKGDLEEAMRYFTDALEVFRNAGLSAEYPHVTSTIRNIAAFRA